MTRYKTIDELNARIEKIIKKTVEAYYTDWKHYDRIKLIHNIASNQIKDKKMILIARRCGTYLLTLDQIAKSTWAATVYEYYQTQEKSDYYFIDLTRLAIEKIEPATFGKTIKKAA